jgi:hypothetical protein
MARDDFAGGGAERVEVGFVVGLLEEEVSEGLVVDEDVDGVRGGPGERDGGGGGRTFGWLLGGRRGGSPSLTLRDWCLGGGFVCIGGPQGYAELF